MAYDQAYVDRHMLKLTVTQKFIKALPVLRSQKRMMQSFTS